LMKLTLHNNVMSNKKGIVKKEEIQTYIG